MVFAGCAGFGFSLAISHKKQERIMMHFLYVLDQMECELKYRLTPLPKLCRGAAYEVDGIIRKVLLSFSEKMDHCILPDPPSCMYTVLEEVSLCTGFTRNMFLDLGKSLGKYDLDGQLMGIEHLREKCQHQLTVVRGQKSERIRCYKTLGLCTGAALVILLV